MDTRIRTTVSIATILSSEEVRHIVMQEFAAIAPSLPLEDLVKERENGKCPILDLQIECPLGQTIVTVTQDAPTPFTLGHQIVLFVGSLILGNLTTMWIPVLLIPIVLLGQHHLDKEAPFTAQQISQALANAKERLASE